MNDMIPPENMGFTDNEIHESVLAFGGGSLRDAYCNVLRQRNRLILALQLALDSGDNATSLKKSISELLKTIQ